MSVKPVEEVDRLAKELKRVQQENNVTIAVGYMLRYSPAVEVVTLLLFPIEAQAGLAGFGDDKLAFASIPGS